MRTAIFAAALLCSTGALAQTADTSATTGADAQATTSMAPAATTTTATSAQGSQTLTGATTQIIALGDHYTVHRVLPNGTVLVETVTGEEAKLAMNGQMPAAIARVMSADVQTASSGLTTGAGTAAPMTSAPADASMSTSTSTTTETQSTTPSPSN